ncbi:MAG: hypothetical protein RH942_12180 [Kiloniellaceae bacterium]
MLNEQLRRISGRKTIAGIAVAIGSFAGLGTTAALWENPFFIRMTPAGGWEIALLLLMSLLLGVYVAVRRPRCSIKSASAGGVLGFIGIACPVCNKILLLLFGGELLLTYFEPVRVYVAAGGTLIIFAALLWELRLLQKENADLRQNMAYGAAESLRSKA